ncbi:DUF2927 domain-containing protein [Amaricoccus tamworthensis]|uniref:DUF2927 domain-containing protein n=1 Tax=Amaricoccus tamworthensis TaxID=57002 RepID=UPI003C7A1482
MFGAGPAINRSGTFPSTAGAVLSLLWVVGCSGPDTSDTTAAGADLEPPAPATEPVDAASAAQDSLTSYYASVENNLTSTGRMRRETAPADAPFGVEDLVRNFDRIALNVEYVEQDGRYVSAETPGILKRWERPIRVGIMNSASISEAEASRDRANVAAYTNRLAGLTGVDMRVVDATEGHANFLVLFLNSQESAQFAERITETYPEFAPAVMRGIRDATADLFCVTYSFSDPNNPATYGAALILIRAEHPAFTRLSCVHEEMAQAMGLPNDSPDARPSLFNTNLEFALLTEHDEMLLRMLYDERLQPGMTAEDAQDILPDVARDAMNEHLLSLQATAAVIN